MRSPIRTAWKCDYPVKSFYGCSGYGTSRRCSLFHWYDPEPPTRYSDVIRKLLKTNEGIRNENMELKKKRQELLDEALVQRKVTMEHSSAALELPRDVWLVIAIKVASNSIENL
ncbi:hypothetical protein Ahy_A03g012611 [Arachis hypogaea]|uniref:Uncharacterized protein n=1 Tax=Arachis hypogaea TaxID=3818 RepID=A0A445DU11_ARAHY|nr:hypothetical protein Ahy_A03g012611 [Arachis hypogaea]